MNNLINYIKESLLRVKYCEFFDGIPVYIDNPLAHHIDVRAVFKKVEELVPSFLTRR